MKEEKADSFSARAAAGRLSCVSPEGNHRNEAEVDEYTSYFFLHARVKEALHNVAHHRQLKAIKTDGVLYLSLFPSYIMGSKQPASKQPLRYQPGYFVGSDLLPPDLFAIWALAFPVPTIPTSILA